MKEKLTTTDKGAIITVSIVFGSIFIIILLGMYLKHKEPICSTPQDIIQQCDDLRQSLDNLSNLIYNSGTND